jgi:hypothetical protein
MDLACAPARKVKSFSTRYSKLVGKLLFGRLRRGRESNIEDSPICLALLHSIFEYTVGLTMPQI